VKPKMQREKTPQGRRRLSIKDALRLNPTKGNPKEKKNIHPTKEETQNIEGTPPLRKKVWVLKEERVERVRGGEGALIIH